MKIAYFVYLYVFVEMCCGVTSISMTRVTKYQGDDVKLSTHFDVTSVSTSEQCLLKCKQTGGCNSMSYNTASKSNNCELAEIVRGSSISADGWMIFLFNYNQIVCPFDWELTDNWCYKLDNTSLKYTEAKELCESYTNGHLIDIGSIEEQNTMKGFAIAHYPLTVPNIWCGLNRNAEGTFEWSDGSTIEMTGFELWAPGQPGTDEDCSASFPQENFQWHDSYCHTRKISICEIDIN